MKKNSLSVIRSARHLSVVDLHSVSREAAAQAAKREKAELERALELIETALSTALIVATTAASTTTQAEIRAATVALTGAGIHLKAAVEALQ